MKKVLVLAAAVMLLATPALAEIAGTSHDLNAGIDTGETCVFCHTPHGGAIGGIAPLWNRTAVNATAVYNSATLNAVINTTSVNASDVPLCLSCHDGSSIAAPLTNMPNGAAFTGSLVNTAGNATIGLDLTNDHPIGFDYVAAQGLDNELRAKATAEAISGMTGALSFGSGNDMWCSSCHDVHGVGPVGSAPPTFLRMDNTNSNLCIACHIK
jgi:predicted CXXCH cytochrome family protein